MFQILVPLLLYSYLCSMKKHVILIENETVKRVFSNFKKSCLIMGLPYNYLKSKDLPINYKGFSIEKREVE